MCGCSQVFKRRQCAKHSIRNPDRSEARCRQRPLEASHITSDSENQEKRWQEWTAGVLTLRCNCRHSLCESASWNHLWRMCKCHKLQPARRKISTSRFDIKCWLVWPKQHCSDPSRVEQDTYQHWSWRRSWCGHWCWLSCRWGCWCTCRSLSIVKHIVNLLNGQRQNQVQHLINMKKTFSQVSVLPLEMLLEME